MAYAMMYGSVTNRAKIRSCTNVCVRGCDDGDGTREREGDDDYDDDNQPMGSR